MARVVESISIQKPSLSWVGGETYLKPLSRAEIDSSSSFERSKLVTSRFCARRSLLFDLGMTAMFLPSVS